MNSSKTFKRGASLRLINWFQNIWIMCTGFFLNTQKILWKLKIFLRMFLLNSINHLSTFVLNLNSKHIFFGLVSIRLIHLFNGTVGKISSILTKYPSLVKKTYIQKISGQKEIYGTMYLNFQNSSG